MQAVEQESPDVAAGDVVEVSRHRVGETARVGEVVEVVGALDHPHYRIRWDDGHESVFFPSSDAIIAHRARAEHDAAAAVVTALRSAGVEFELLSRPRTPTAMDEAKVLGLLPQEVAKTLIVRAGGELVRVVLAASDRLDFHLLSGLLGCVATLVPESELPLLYPQFEIGAVPPFAGTPGERVLIDIGLCKSEHVVLAAGAHDCSVRIRTDDLLHLADAQLAAVAT